MIAGCGGSEPAADGGGSADPEVAAGAATSERLFAPDSFWNEQLPDDAAIDPTSEALVAGLKREVAREQEEAIGPFIATENSTPLYEVPADQPTVRVALEDPEQPEREALQEAFTEVPLPPDAEPAEGPDGHLTVWQPERDRLWEFFRLREEADGWHAEWGGAIEDVSEFRGYYTSDAWPGAHNRWGATATSMPVIGGVMTLEELAAGEIDHALALNLPFPRAEVYSWPAQRTDGTAGPDAIPEGARLRIDPELDLDGLELHPLTRLMAEAAQRHGMVVRDRTGQAITFSAENAAPTGSDPYYGEDGYFRDQFPTGFLAQFPWEHVQVLELSLCSNQFELCRRR